ncbi:hypothetical protein KAU19_05545 [Candidatus Parcubacteria bacterium]|nr:hypothetical protein [Candidatus Parcubacteria bacterium]
MAKEERHRSPFLWLGLIVALMALILILSLWQPTKKKQDQPPSTEPTIAQVEKGQQSQEQIAKTTDDKAKFPLTAWLVIAGGLLLLRASGELYLAIKSGKTEIQWITPDMLSIGLGVITVVVLMLQAFYPDQWWSSLCQSPLGKPLLLALGTLVLVWYILPGTGNITLKLGKPFCIIVGIGLIIILVFTATGGELKKNGQWTWQKWFEGKKVEAKISPRTSQERIVLFRNFNLTKTEKFIGIINPGERFQYISPVWFYLKTEIGEKVPYMPSQNPGEIRYIQSDFGNILPGGYRLYISSKDQAAIIKYRFK